LIAHFDRSAIDAIVLDIEGTTTPIAFVYEVLFPFARQHLHDYLQDRQGSDELRDVIARLRHEWREETAPPPWSDEPANELSSAESYVEWLMDRDRKSPALKLLQGRIWELGYRSGVLKGDLYPDVVPAIERWRAFGVKVAIYSSGSEQAQRLLFAHTPAGDLTSLFEAFFDTHLGAKTSSASYRRIGEVLDCSTDRLIFVSDAGAEIDAARAAGCHTVLCVRPGNPLPPTNGPVVAISSLDQIVLSP
jgi:enolase-phosphatase E1